MGEYNITGGNQGVVGDNASATNVVQTDNRKDSLSANDLVLLADQLATLRARIADSHTVPDRESTAAMLEDAERAARLGDQKTTFEKLKGLGKWVVDFGTNIGTTIAAKVISKQMGLE